MESMPDDHTKKTSTKKETSSVRDALSRVKTGEAGQAERPVVSAREIGHTVPEEESGLSRPFSLGGPSHLDRAMFCRQFATLIEVGIPVLKALRMLSERTPNKQLRRAVQEAAQGVEEGQAIHQAMARNMATFTPLVVNIVRVGEVGGILEDSLVRLAEIMESKSRIRRRIVSASMYPIVAICVAIVVVIVIMTRAIPAFAEVYGSTGAELPGLTRFMIGLSGVFVSGWWVILILLVLVVFGLKMWGRLPGGARFFSWLYLHVPIMRGINRKICTARFSRSLGALLKAGIPLTDALLITADSSENLLIADALREVHQSVEAGERMTRPLSEADILPELVVDMISIGEETGTLDQMLAKVAEIYEEEVDTMLAGLTSIIEPLLIVLLGGVVIFIALSVLLPYFNMVNVVGLNNG
jgi:type IV pilus assembly protein PilC